MFRRNKNIRNTTSLAAARWHRRSFFERKTLDEISGRTVLVVAHRLSTVVDADCVVVVEDGSIRDKGTHVELLKSSDTYANLVKNQLFAGDDDEIKTNDEE